MMLLQLNWIKCEDQLLNCDADFFVFKSVTYNNLKTLLHFKGAVHLAIPSFLFPKAKLSIPITQLAIILGGKYIVMGANPIGISSFPFPKV